MSSVTIPIKTKEHPYMRPLNMFRDLSTVADLIELCFSPTMDNDGQRYLSDMRRASHDDTFLRWASRMTETTSLPLAGYVWEQDGRIIGNASLIPFRDKGKRIYLIANVAVHPDHRRRGIGRALTERAMKQARDKKASAIWLHVRDDNPGAIKLYQDLGFREIARRTTWSAMPDAFLPKPFGAGQDKPDVGIQIVPRDPRFWPKQQEWLRHLYPESLNWYHSWNISALRPGLWNWLYLLFVDFNIRQWAAVRRGQLLATLAWMPQRGRSESMYAATSERGGGERPMGPYRDQGSEAEALKQLLIHARRVLSNHSSLSLDYPAGEMVDAIRAAGFQARRTLLWMRA